MTVQFPVLQGIVNLLKEGPNATTETSSGSEKLPPLIVAFTHDNQINELASILGVFDNQEPLSAQRIDRDRVSLTSLSTAS
jgi:acid phosphatase